MILDIIIIILLIILIIIIFLKDNNKIINDINLSNRQALKEQKDDIQKIIQQHQTMSQLSANNHNDLIIKTISEQNIRQAESQVMIIETLNQKLEHINNQNRVTQDKIIDKLDEKLESIRKTNEEKIQNIEKSINEKLEISLNNRIDSSFKSIGENLSSLHKTIGELRVLSDGVTDLNKTLSNVKTRGVWGEMQLGAIIEEIMTPAQYEKNVPMKKNSRENVEFAIKIPDKTGDEFIYLPIDSKMPTDIYRKIVDAETKNEEQAAQKELIQRIKSEAKTINEKYINPPYTCNFAIMFLPTESLYAEILRLDGLFELCQSQYKVIIAGPSTITAILNSLRVGFSNMAINKKSQEVLRVLQAIKSQYGTLSDAIDDTQKALEQAINKTNKMKDRTRIIQNKMNKIEELEINEANELLGITEYDD